ncbi:MAG: hypothetical protein PHI97_00535 [Desulfobulbus sp.]|jgi:hypothetical protein|nr:hypothetical protein [Desulfobulbus sp.]
MANYYTRSIIQPEIPAHLLTKFHLAILDAFSIELDEQEREHGKTYYLYAPDSPHFTAFDREFTEDELADCDPVIIGFFEVGKELDEDDLIALFQVIIKNSNGELPWISIEQSYNCSKMLPDGFGGSALLVTADDVQFMSTSQWLEQRIGEVESGDTGPHTDEPEASAPQDEKPLLCIVLQGGLVNDVVSNRPEAFSGSECMVIDYDTEDCDPEDVIVVSQGGGKISTAVGRIEPIALSGIELQPVLAQLTK